ncbi:MAG: hypothetical protein IKY27_00260 [Bacteroidales bacterium]|nr:hypothetical protein [Bacteroidales bacterium]
MKNLIKKFLGKREKTNDVHEKCVRNAELAIDEYMDSVLKSIDSRDEELKRRNEDLRNKLDRVKEFQR